MRAMNDKPDGSMEIIEAQPRLPTLRRSDGFSRQQVISAFQDAFEIMGGTTRLALWANANPDKFYPLYSKLLPAQSAVFVEQTQRVIHHAIPPSALDHHPGFEAPTVQVVQEEPVPREE